MRDERNSDICTGKIKCTKEEKVYENQLEIFRDQVFTAIEYSVWSDK